MKKEDEIDYKAGITLNKKVGDKVNVNDIIAYIHTDKELIKEDIKESIIDIVEISELDKEVEEKTILKILM